MPAINLDEVLDAIDVSAKEVTLKGQSFNVRRDLTGPEIARYWELVRGNDDVGALNIMVGEDSGERLNTLLESLPAKQMTATMRKMMEIAGLLAEGTSGE